MDAKTTHTANDLVASALINARHELTKLKIQGLSHKKIDDYKQSQSTQIIEQSVTVADNVLKRLVAHTVGHTVEDLFDDCLGTIGQIFIESTDTEHGGKYIMQLDIVDKDYMLDLKDLNENNAVKQRMIFLLDAVKVLYCSVKDRMKKWAELNDTTFEYMLELDSNTTLYLDSQKNKRIGITLQSVTEFPN